MATAVSPTVQSRRRLPHAVVVEALAAVGAGTAVLVALHIGDNPVNDVEAAQVAGIRAILLDRTRSAPLGPDIAHDLDGVRVLLGI